MTSVYAYRNLFDTTSEAIEFEDQVLSACPKYLLPKEAIKVLNDQELDDQEESDYYDFLMSQKEQMDFEDDWYQEENAFSFMVPDCD